MLLKGSPTVTNNGDITTTSRELLHLKLLVLRLFVQQLVQLTKEGAQKLSISCPL